MMDNLFFVASKLAWALLSPGNAIILSFLLGLLLLMTQWQRLAKSLLWLTSFVSLMVLLYPVGDWLIEPLERQYSQPITMPEQVDGIILLGGGEDLKRSLSWQVAELGLAADRYVATKKLADLYSNVPVYFTGGSGSLRLQNTKGEASVAEVLLTDLDIAKERLVLETQSRNTYENFMLLKPLLATKGRYLLVTSAFHMPRSVAIAEKVGIDVIPYPVDYRSNRADMRYIELDLFDHLKSLEPAVSEWIGLFAYRLSGKID